MKLVKESISFKRNKENPLDSLKIGKNHKYYTLLNEYPDLSYETFEMYNKFLEEGFEVEENFDEDGFSATNKKGWSIYFKYNKKEKVFYKYVQGYSNDIPLDEGSTFEDLKSTLKMITTKWMRENDPKGYNW